MEIASFWSSLTGNMLFFVNLKVFVSTMVMWGWQQGLELERDGLPLWLHSLRAVRFLHQARYPSDL